MWYAFLHLLKKEIEELWGFCLIGYFSGKFPGKSAFEELCKSWGVKHLYQHHDSGWIIFKFMTEEDRQKVLHGGPYIKFKRQLHLKSIPKHFHFNTKEMSIVL